MKKYIGLSLLLLMIVFASAQKSFACSCVMSPEPIKTQVKNAFTGADAIFSGEVVEITSQDEYHFAVKFKLAKSWKGEFAKEITIITAKDGSMCGYAFEIGKKYIVYANGKNDELSTTNCSRTAIFGEKSDGKYLDKLKRKKANSR